MFSDKTLEFIAALHKSNIRACLITAGAGSTAVSALMSVPGCSKTLLDAQVPYSVASTIELLDNYPHSYVSPSVAANLSHTAYARAQKLVSCPCNPPNALHGHINNFATSRNDNTAAIRSSIPLMTNQTTANDTSTPPPSNNTSFSTTQHQQHRHHSGKNIRIVGLGATAAISTVPDRKGEDRVHACCRTEEGVYFRSLTMTKGLERHVQEWMVSCVLLQLLADVSDMVVEPNSDEFVKELCLSMIDESKTELRAAITKDLSTNLVKTHMPLGPNPFSLLLDGKIQKLLFNRYGVPHFDGRKDGVLKEHNEFHKGEPKLKQLPFYEEDDDGFERNGAVAQQKSGSNRVHKLLYPGSFNPLHYGHTLLAQVAQNVVSSRTNDGKPVVLTFEVAASRVDKETIRSPEHFANIANQFLGSRVVFSSAKLFIDKARMFPNHGFVVGVDTAERILQTKYYNDSRDEMIKALLEIGKYNCYFLVAGRKYGTNGWTCMEAVETPQEISHLFIEIPETEFRVDISSTELRERKRSFEALAASSTSNNSSPTGTTTNNSRSPFPSSVPATPMREELVEKDPNNNKLPAFVSDRAGSWAGE